MGYYPIFLEMKDRPCLVVGGGQVAQRKVEGLLAADAAVTVVSPDLTEGLEALQAEGRSEHRLREELEAYLSDDFAPLVELLAEVRGDLRAQGVSVEAEAWQRAIDGRLRELLSAGRRAEAKSHLQKALGVDI